jgi:hypothetical protein
LQCPNCAKDIAEGLTICPICFEPIAARAADADAGVVEEDAPIAAAPSEPTAEELLRVHAAGLQACSSCGAASRPWGNYCPHCGAALEVQGSAYAVELGSPTQGAGDAAAVLHQVFPWIGAPIAADLAASAPCPLPFLLDAQGAEHVATRLRGVGCAARIVSVQEVQSRYPGLSLWSVADQVVQAAKQTGDWDANGRQTR